MAQVPNVLLRVEPTEGNPVFLYFQYRFQKPYSFEHDIVVAVDDVLGRKVSALDAHESQFYEWLPWVSNVLGEVPEDNPTRQDWLHKR